MIMENLATISVEVGETFPRIVNTRRTHQQPQAEPASLALMTQRPTTSIERRVSIEKRELSSWVSMSTKAIMSLNNAKGTKDTVPPRQAITSNPRQGT